MPSSWHILIPLNHNPQQPMSPNTIPRAKANARVERVKSHFQSGCSHLMASAFIWEFEVRVSVSGISREFPDVFGGNGVAPMPMFSGWQK